MSEDNLLQRLDVNDPTLTVCRVDAASNITLDQLALALTNSSFVEAVFLDNIPVGEAFLEVLKTVTHLQHLKLSGARLSVATARKLCEIQAAAFETLDLSHNPKLGPRGCKVLAEGLLTKTLNLNVLILTDVGMGHYGAQAMHLPTTLQTLNLSHNALGHDGLWKLAERFPMLTALNTLDLSYNKCLDDGCLEVARHVPVMQQLTTLNLAGNDIGDTGMQALARSLAGSSVQELYLHDNKITDIGVKALAEQALSRACFDSGDSSSSNDSDSDSENSGQLPPPVSNLCLIDLSSNQIGSAGCTALAQALSKGAHTLHSLNLSCNKIGDEGAGSFVELVDDIASLHCLDLSNNPLSEARTRILDMLLKHRTPRKAGLRDNSECSETTHTDHEDSCNSDHRQELISNTLVDREGIDEESRELLRNLVLNPKTTDGAKEIRSAFFEYLTDNFSAQRILSYGKFGPLYLVKDSSVIDDANFVARNLVLEQAGPMKAVRNSVLTEISYLRHARLLHPVAYSQAPSSYCFLYDVTNRCSLAELLRDESRRKPMTWTIRINILTAITEALVYLHAGDTHRRPMFHGDIQPNNIFIASDLATVQVADAGLSRLMATDRKRFAAGDVVFGSRGYRCPRYERGSCQYDAASDMFSLGVVMAEIVTGRLQRSKGEMGMAWDFYYEVILKRQPLETDRLAGPIPKQFMERLAQVISSCVTVVIEKRPKATNIAHILSKQ